MISANVLIESFKEDDDVDDAPRTPRRSMKSLDGDEEPLKETALASLRYIDWSGCNALFEGVIVKYYIPFALWYFRSTIHQVSLPLALPLYSG